MDAVERLHDAVRARRASVFVPPRTGVLAWHLGERTAAALAALPPGSTSSVRLDDRLWLRNVAANPNVDVDALVASVRGL